MKARLGSLAVVALLGTGTLAGAVDLAVGDPAPDFQLAASDG